MYFRTNKNSGKIDFINLLVFIGLYFVLIIYGGIWSTLDCYVHDFWQNLRLNINKSSLRSPISEKLFPVKDFNQDIVLILVDDSSLLRVKGLFENDKSVFAHALNNLAELNPKTVGLDIFFGTSSDETQYQDRLLAKSVANLKDKIVLKAYRRDDNHITEPYPELVRYVSSSPSYFRNYRDRATRSVSLVFKTVMGKIRPSFLTMLWTNFAGLSLTDLSFEQNYLTVKGEKFIKLINNEYMLINYNKPIEKFRRFTFFDLYENNIPKSEIEGKLIIIGYSNSLTPEKLYTPTHENQFSPVLNALCLSNILEKCPLNVIPFWVTSLITFIIMGSLFMACNRLSPVWSLISVIAVNVILYGSSLLALTLYNMQFDIICPAFGSILAFIFTVGKKYYIEYSEKRHIKSAFQHYVTASVVNEIIKNPEKLNLHGEEKNLTIFFSDIEGFTTLSEGMSPLDVVSLLNEYLTAMTDIIFEFNGLLDKYEGDAIMAVFGAPVDHTDHAIRACRCALKNQRVLCKLREKWHNEGKPEIRVRIGINTGIVVVGNMGSTMRFDYTVIGDNVNLAARLETANKMFGTTMLISEETAKLAEQGVVTRKIASLKAIGKSVVTNVYEILADKISDSADEIRLANEAKKAYELADSLLNEREFEEAEKVLGIYLKNNDNDIPAKTLYKKIKGFMLIPPPHDWKNIVTQEMK